MAEDKYIVGSVFVAPEVNEWGFKYSFTTNKKIKDVLNWDKIAKAIESVLN